MHYWYLASPYSKYADGFDAAFDAISEIAARLMDLDLNLFCPISHTHPIARYSRRAQDDSAAWTRLQVPIMDGACGMIIAEMDSWESSRGIGEEREIFKTTRKPILRAPVTVLLEHPERIVSICRCLGGKR